MRLSTRGAVAMDDAHVELSDLVGDRPAQAATSKGMANIPWDFGLVAGKVEQRLGSNAGTAKGLRTAEIGKIDDEKCMVDHSARPPKQLGPGESCAAGRDEVIDQKDTFSRVDGTGIYLDPGGAIFQRVVDTDGLDRQLARLANGDEPET